MGEDTCRDFRYLDEEDIGSGKKRKVRRTQDRWIGAGRHGPIGSERMFAEPW